MNSLYIERNKPWKENDLKRRNVCCNKPIAHRPNVWEQNSRGKNIFPFGSLMCHYSSLNYVTHISTNRYSPFLSLQNNQKSSTTTKLTCWGLNCLSPQGPNKFYCSELAKGSPRGPQGMYMRLPVTWMVSVIHYNTHNIPGIQNIIWQVYEKR
jgi:hypothetical protein